MKNKHFHVKHGEVENGINSTQNISKYCDIELYNITFQFIFRTLFQVKDRGFKTYTDICNLVIF